MVLSYGIVCALDFSAQPDTGPKSHEVLLSLQIHRTRFSISALWHSCVRSVYVTLRLNSVLFRSARRPPFGIVYLETPCSSDHLIVIS